MCNDEYICSTYTVTIFFPRQLRRAITEVVTSVVAEKRGRGEVIQIYATRRGHRMRGIQVDTRRGLGSWGHEGQ